MPSRQTPQKILLHPLFWATATCLSTAQVTEAVRLAREARPDLALEGPIQYDAAVDPAVAKQKVKSESRVAGRANVCIFPDLNTGNNTYKAR